MSSQIRIIAWFILYGLLAAVPVRAQPLDILVYGATGKLGTHIVTEALDRGHRVTAVSRNPEQIEISAPNLSAVYGDLLDDESIRSLATGQDVIVVSVRGIIGPEKTAENALQRIAVERVVAVLREIGDSAPRLIHVGGAGTLIHESGELYAERLPRFFLPRGLEAEIDGQVLALEMLRGVTDVDWTYVTPPRNFTNGPRTGEYRLGGDAMLEDRRGRSRISRADFAVAVIDEAESAAHRRRRISVAW